jgi:hypothetical protein
LRSQSKRENRLFAREIDVARLRHRKSALLVLGARRWRHQKRTALLLRATAFCVRAGALRSLCGSSVKRISHRGGGDGGHQDGCALAARSVAAFVCAACGWVSLLRGGLLNVTAAAHRIDIAR